MISQGDIEVIQKNTNAIEKNINADQIKTS